MIRPKDVPEEAALAAGALLKRAKAEGIVKSKYVHGRGYGRTIWKIIPEKNEST